MRVAYTPGHASHHVSYLHEDSGTAFTGDVTGVRIPPSSFIVPPTPPPDIDIEAWEESIGIVEDWRPQRLALTHFGQVDNPAEHLATFRERLREEAELARNLSEHDYEMTPPRARRGKRPSRDGGGAASGRRARLPVARPRPLLAQARGARSGLGQVLAHPLDRLFDAVVGGGEGDAEEALAARPVHRAR